METSLDVSRPDTIEKLERYWSETLIPFAATAGLPPDYPRSSTARAEVVELGVPLNAALAKAVVDLHQGKAPKVFAMVLTACTVLLHRVNGDEEVSVLTPVTQANSDEVGTNRWLVIKNAIVQEEPLGDLMERVRNQFASAITHQDYPFARVLEILGATWPANRAPLSDLAVAFDGISRMDVLTDIDADLTVLGALRDRKLALGIRYRKDLFAEDTISGFGELLASVLGELLSNPGCRVSDLRLVTADKEAEALLKLREWDDHLLADQRVEDLILDAAALAPTQIAFVHGQSALTYHELITQAHSLASVLRNSGVAPGDRVVVALDLGLSLPVALLATWMSGAAFVPLDPRHPAPRLQGILRQVKPACILAEGRLTDTVEGLGRIISLGGQTTVLDGSSTSDSLRNAPIPLSPDAVAYVMFTSGSTGEPNGVEVGHRSLVNYLSWAKQCYLSEEQLAFALYSSIAFDLTLTSILLPLVAGCCTVIFSTEDPVVDMNAIFNDPRIGVVKATPSHLKLLRLNDLRNSRVRRVIVGGEAFEWNLADSLQHTLGAGAKIFNEYGPTEATIGCMVHEFTSSDRPAGTVPIGRAIWNAGLYLLDQQRRPVPACMQGEIWISGVPVALGYLGKANLTAERFVEDPFRPGNHMYPTGDRARYDAAGRLYYLGRKDDQVKYKGVRIELNELREALNCLPRVRDSVVRVVLDERGNQTMIACYVARQTIDVSILREGLLKQLPQEMIPSLFVRLAKMPLTLNGKIDLNRLPSLKEVSSSRPQVFVPPRTDTEKTLAAVWSEVLDVSEINVHSNFFELGGHSLLASQVVWKLSESLGVDVPLRLLFDAPTIAGLAAALDERR